MKLARHSSPWTTLTVPQMAVKVRPRCPCPLTLNCLLPAPASFGRVQSIVRPRPGAATSQRRSSTPRAESPTYWVPRLFAPPSGCRTKPGSQPRHTHTVHRTHGQSGILPQTPSSSPSPTRTVPYRFSACTMPLALPHLEEGEATLGIAHYLCCEGKSYSGPI